MKYELTEETKVFYGTTLHRIRAKKAFGNVAQGELGGWIKKEENLNQDGEAWITGRARVDGEARVNSSELVQIGCHGYPIKRWLKSYKAVGKKEGYSEQEIAEYGAYLRMIDEVLGISVPSGEEKA